MKEGVRKKDWEMSESVKLQAHETTHNKDVISGAGQVDRRVNDTNKPISNTWVKNKGIE